MQGLKSSFASWERVAMTQSSWKYTTYTFEYFLIYT